MTASDEARAGPDLVDLFNVVAARRRFVLAVAAAVTAACAAYALLATPYYRATTVLAPAENERAVGGLGSALGQLGSLASLAGVGGLDQKNTFAEEALAVLRSREFLERFINERQLLPRLFSSRWDAQARRWRSSWLWSEPTPARGVAYLSDNVLAAVRDKKTGLVTLTVDWRDRNEAAEWANDLVARVNLEMRNRAMVRAAAYTQFLEKELQATDLVATREAINRLIEEQLKQRMLATVTQEFAFRTVGRALPPDADDIVRPRRTMLIIAGAVFGLIAGAVAALVMAVMRGTIVERRARADR